MRAIDTETALCAVIGHPVRHSLSPAIHNAAFDGTGLNFVYLAFDILDPKAFLAGMRTMPSFRGLSVTIPHKRAVIPHLDSIDPVAERIGSVNTVVNDRGRLHGLSTDGPGTLRAFAEAGVALEGRRVLFLGTGGAVRAVAFAFAELAGPACITILGRTTANVAELTADLENKTSVAIRGGGLDSVTRAMTDHDVVIQGTPLGMAPEFVGQSCVPANTFRAGQIAFDMVYKPASTRFLIDAAAAGCIVISGLEMLLHQAALQFEAWTGLSAPIHAMRRAVEFQLGPVDTRPTAASWRGES